MLNFSDNTIEITIFCYSSILSQLTACVANSAYISLHQDGDILASSFPVETQVAYILSLGVVKEFRKHGVGERGLFCAVV